MFGDSFFKRVENKTNVDKNTILSLAKKIQDGNMKDEKTLREVVSEISNLTGREVSKEKEDKIINTIINDNVPNDIDKNVLKIKNHYIFYSDFFISWK